MRPEAHVAAAVDVLDDILDGVPAEQRLTRWARAHRFAGSSDRAAIRDIVFDALRRRRSYAWLGKAQSGRGLMIGALRAAGVDPDTVFHGDGYAPDPLTDAERAGRASLDAAPEAVRLDVPDWILTEMHQAYGDAADGILSALRDRAPVFLRVNLAKSTRVDAITVLAKEEITAVPHELAETALVVTGNARRLRNSRAFADGLVELQDGASQAVVAACLPFVENGRVLDYCAGGGGKSLAFAAAGVADVTAHDAAPERMKDIAPRAARAGTPVRTVTRTEGVYDLVLCDAPCSGSGAWRRQPDAKWTLDAAQLATLTGLQDDILDAAQHHVAPGGTLAYATCSLLRVENGARIEAFTARNRGWKVVDQRQWTPREGGDGFFLAILQRS